MGSKNNPKNRGTGNKNKVFNGKEVEPIMFVDPVNKKKYLSAKYLKTTDIICGEDKNPIRWDAILEDK